ncbi:MAG: hypothetical protein LBP57_00025 [Endomicrobium sp.]|nr:hypothetical protein [Endomicrobium sp.]
MITINNIREITKKEKIKGLSRNAWAISATFAATLFPHIIFYSILVFLFSLSVFYVIEFFDEDFIDIFIARVQAKAKNEYFG